MKITPYGYRHVIVASIVMFLLAAATAACAMFWCQWISFAVLIPGLVYCWLVWFFRDPDRRVPGGPGLFVSPADGTVADITQVGADSELGCEGVKIGVFMSIFSVHVNRIPCAGRVVDIVHRDGQFLDVRRTDAHGLNEATTISLMHEYNGREYRIIFRQIAGLVARRIVTDLEKGQEVARGDRFGMIRFGSRLELCIPGEISGHVAVSVGEHVRAGLSILYDGSIPQKD
jgi:phosphatidylserine decarboxylase